MRARTRFRRPRTIMRSFGQLAANTDECRTSTIRPTGSSSLGLIYRGDVQRPPSATTQGDSAARLDQNPSPCGHSGVSHPPHCCGGSDFEGIDNGRLERFGVH